MRRLAPAVFALFLLAGCTSSPAAESSNQAPCAEFSSATNRYAELAVNVLRDEGLSSAEDEEFANYGATYAAISLKAEGAVSSRIIDVTRIVDDEEVTLAMKNDNYFRALESVAQACEADGFTISYGTWK